MELGRYDEAARLLGPLLAEEPDDIGLHGLDAQVRLGRGDLPGVLAAGDRIVALAPDQEAGHRICSVALRELRRHDEAVEAATRSVQLAPFSHRPHTQLALAALGVPHLLRTAEAAAHRAVELGPHEPDAHFAVGLVATQLNHLDEARVAYARVLELDPQSSAARNNLTLLGSRLRLADQLTGLSSALAHDPQDPVIQANVRRAAAALAWRLQVAALVGLVVGLLASYSADEGGPVTVTGVVTGLAVLAGQAAYAVALARRVPPGVRTYVRSWLVRDRLLLATVVLAGLMTATMAIACFVPGGVAFGLVALRPLGFATIAAVVATVVARRG